MKGLLFVALAVCSGLLIVLAGCDSVNPTTRDLEGVPVHEPDKAEVILNVDEFGNLSRQCIDGLAFAFTTHDYPAVVRVPEWDKSWCAE